MSEASAVFYLNATVKVTYIHGGIKCCQCFVSFLLSMQKTDSAADAGADSDF